MDELDEGRKEEAVTSTALNTPVTPTEEEKEEALGEQEQPVQAEPQGEVAPEAPAPSQDPDSPGVSEGHALSQEQVNDLMGKTRAETRERTFRYIYDRYGVGDEAGLDELVGNAQRYDSLSEKYDSDRKAWKDADAQRESELDELRGKVALMQSGIDPARYDDASYIIKGKGLKIGDDTLAAELEGHPEWRKREPVAAPESRISVLGNEKEGADAKDAESEEERAMRMFKV